MRWTRIRRALVAPALVSAALCVSCSKEEGPGPMEKLGKEVDSAAQKAGEVVSDGTITAQVKAALALNKDVDAMKINVDTKDGVVTLRGTVATAAAKEDAERIAKGVRGVKTVVSELHVVP